MSDVSPADTPQNGLVPDPATIIEQGAYWTLVLNRNQNLLGKVMLVANRSVEQVSELTSDEWITLHTQIRRTTTALTTAFHPDHYSYAFLQNQDRQVHLHVIPRYATLRTFEGLTFSDADYPHHYAVPSPRRILEVDQVATLRDLLRALLPSLSSGESE